jgi:hypothetical protein
LIRVAVEQRMVFLRASLDSLYSIEIFWVVMINGSCRKTGLLHSGAAAESTALVTNPAPGPKRRQTAVVRS